MESADAEHARTEAELRTSVQHLAFLLKLSDALRPLTEPVAVQQQAAQILGEFLEANRVGYAETQADERLVAITFLYTHGVPGIEGVYRYQDYGPALLRDMQRGKTVVRPDIAHDPTLTDAEKHAHAVLQLGATVNVPLVKQKRLVAIFFVHSQQAHTWMAGEISLIEEVADRTWAAVERVRADTALRESEARFRTLTDVVPQVVWANTADGVANYFNESWFTYSGLSLEESFGLGWQAIVYPDDAPASVERWQAALATGTVFDTEYRLRRADGVYRWHLGRNVPLHSDDGQVIGWFGTATDIEDRKQAEQAVRHANAKLEGRVTERTAALEVSNQALQEEIMERTRAEADRAALLAQIVTTQEAERQRIARELHDSLGQFLTALTLRLSAAQQIADIPAEVQATFADLRAVATQIDAEVDRLTMELRPPALDDMGLVDALATYTEQWSATSGVAVDLLPLGVEGARLPAAIEATIYRIVQEALTNVAKHAGASEVNITVERRSDGVRVVIEDNGVGFDHDTVPDSGVGGRHVGLIGMAERANLVGGELTIESAPDEGTTVYLGISLRDGVM